MAIHNFLSIGSSMHPLKLKAGTNNYVHPSILLKWIEEASLSLVCKLSNQLRNHADDWSESIGFLDWRFFLKKMFLCPSQVAHARVELISLLLSCSHSLCQMFHFYVSG